MFYSVYWWSELVSLHKVFLADKKIKKACFCLLCFPVRLKFLSQILQLIYSKWIPRKMYDHYTNILL